MLQRSQDINHTEARTLCGAAPPGRGRPPGWPWRGPSCTSTEPPSGPAVAQRRRPAKPPKAALALLLLTSLLPAADYKARLPPLAVTPDTPIHLSGYANP